MTWWTETGHATMPKAVIDLMAEAAMDLREEIVSEILYGDSELHPHVGVPVFDSLDPKTRSLPSPTCSGTSPSRTCHPPTYTPGTRGPPGPSSSKRVTS